MVNTPVTFWFALATITLQASSTVIELGSSLRAGQSWDSPHKSFRFGLWPSGSKNNMLALAIRFFDGTTVWSATTETLSSELQVSPTAVVLLESEGILVKDGEKVVWKTCINSSCTTGIDNASMLDTGNFVLLEKSAVVWSSFDNATDTLLPGQQLIGEDQALVSGRYRLRLEKKQVLLESLDFKPPNSANSRKPSVNYWSLQTENTEAVKALGDPKLNFSSNGILSFFDATGKSKTDDDSQSNLPAACRNFLRSESTIRYAIDYDSSNVSMRRLKLEPNGNLVSYSLEKGSKTWKRVWQAVLNECEIYATCGPFGICTFRPTRSCTCPPGFHHQNKDDDSSGCVHNFPIDGSDTKLVSISRVHYEYGNEQVSNEQYLPVTSMETCKMSCLKDSQCVAAEFKIDGTGVCYKKIGKLYNGRQNIAGDSHAVVFMKISVLDVGAVSDPSDPFVSNVSASNPDINVFNRKITSVTFRVVVLLACMLLLAFGIVITVGLLWRRDRQRSMRKYMIDIEGAPAIFSYKELQDATNNFTEKLGSGGFGSVYKGVLADKRIVAVKDLQGAYNVTRQQFKVEVSTIATIHHVNLVRLLGYCAEGEHRLLVLEYMTKGSLEKLLFTKKINSADHESINFDWTTRFNIALGIARGITYLHEECHECILHCDIKPHNILLGDNFVPKLSDFGLAKLVSKEQVLSVTTIRGTRGYIAPEWVSNSQITPKVDVYSFGMVLMELVSGKDVSTLTPSAEDNGVWSFPSLAFYKLRDSDLGSILDQRLMLGGEVDWRQIERVVKIALWCIQLEPSTRPSMNKVVQMLEDNVDVSMPPLPKMLDNDTISVFVDDPSKSSATLTGR